MAQAKSVPRPPPPVLLSILPSILPSMPAVSPPPGLLLPLLPLQPLACHSLAR